MRDSVKSKEASNIRALYKIMDRTFEEVSRTDPEFGEALKKWRFLLFSSIRKVAALQKSSELDVFQDFMVPLSRINSMQEVPLYRYKKKVYEIDRVDGFNVRLKSSRYNVKGINVVWTRRERVVPVKKASISSLVYKKIQQQASVMVRAVFTKKNGYTVFSKEKGAVKVRNGEYGEKAKYIDKNNVVLMHSEVSIDASVSENNTSSFLDIIPDYKSCVAEDVCIRHDISQKILKNLSKPAQEVYKLFMKFPTVTDRDLTSVLKLSKKKVSYAKREIQQAFEALTKIRYKSVKAPYVIYKDNYYYLDREDGSNVIIYLSGVKKHVPKNNVRIEEEMSYRTPIHLTAGMVA